MRVITAGFLFIALFIAAVYAQGASNVYRVTGVANDDVLNVRAQPTTKSPIVGALRPDATGIEDTGDSRQVGRSVWRKIRHAGISGWVNQRYLATLETATRSVADRTATIAAPSGQLATVLGKRVALVIGNGRYTNGISMLANAPNDGRDITAALKSLGFDVLHLIDADLDATSAALATFTERAEGAEIALFFFAGHGIQVNGENYLLPTSARLEQPEDLLTQATSVADIMAAFAKAKPALSMIILDACRNNPVTEILASQVRSRGISGIRIEKGLAKRSGLPGMMIVYSTNPDNVALDGKGRNSPFTKALLQKIAEPEVEVRLMFGAVRDAVVEATDGSQTPWMEEAVLGRYFFRPPPEVRPSLFHGVWHSEHKTLHIDDKSVALRPAPHTGQPPVMLAPAGCGQVFTRTYSTLKIDRIARVLGNKRVEQWARRQAPIKTVRLMEITCESSANIYRFLMGAGTQMLATHFSEQDWLMIESFDKDIR